MDIIVDNKQLATSSFVLQIKDYEFILLLRFRDSGLLSHFVLFVEDLFFLLAFN